MFNHAANTVPSHPSHIAPDHMPHFEENPLANLALKPDAVEQRLDLTGLSQPDAMRQVEQLLNASQRPNGVSIHFSAAANDGKETLFLPLGRRLLEARRAGLLKSCLPTAEGNAYVIRFADDD
jgi:hypothetical protein